MGHSVSLCRRTRLRSKLVHACRALSNFLFLNQLIVRFDRSRFIIICKVHENDFPLLEIFHISNGKYLVLFSCFSPTSLAACLSEPVGQSWCLAASLDLLRCLSATHQLRPDLLHRRVRNSVSGSSRPLNQRPLQIYVPSPSFNLLNSRYVIWFCSHNFIYYIFL